MSAYGKGESLAWDCEEGVATGKATQRFTGDFKIEINGRTVERQASEQNPVYLIELENGDKILKSEAELRPA